MHEVLSNNVYLAILEILERKRTHRSSSEVLEWNKAYQPKSECFLRGVFLAFIIESALEYRLRFIQHLVHRKPNCEP